MGKRLVVSILLLLKFGEYYSQITTTSVHHDEAPEAIVYDSAKNFLGDNAMLYKGQVLYLKGVNEALRKYGYRGFLLDYSKSDIDKNNIYKSNGEFASLYDSLVGHYFQVTDVLKHPRAMENEYVYGHKFFLKLKERNSSSVIYYEYDGQFEFSFPFIVVGYFEKTKNSVLNHNYIFRNSLIEGSLNVVDGKPISVVTGERWKCIDLTIEEKYFHLSLLVENQSGQRITVICEALSNSALKEVYTESEYKKYLSLYGAEKLNLILQGKVKIGMTKEMCKLSWGNPSKVNTTLVSGKKTEQWVYSDSYLYFDGEILTTIQN